MIETERLLLRPHVLADFEDSMAMWSHPDTVRFITGTPATEEESWQRFMRYGGFWGLLGFGVFAVFERASGHFVGEVGLADFKRGLGPSFDGVPEAAWVMAPVAHGKGYAVEAARAAHAWIAAERGASRTVCIISPDNAPSLRVAERLGYAEFGRAEYKGNTVAMFERFA